MLFTSFLLLIILHIIPQSGLPCLFLSLSLPLSPASSLSPIPSCLSLPLSLSLSDQQRERTQEGEVYVCEVDDNQKAGSPGVKFSVLYRHLLFFIVVIRIRCWSWRLVWSTVVWDHKGYSWWIWAFSFACLFPQSQRDVQLSVSAKSKQVFWEPVSCIVAASLVPERECKSKRELVRGRGTGIQISTVKLREVDKKKKKRQTNKKTCAPDLHTKLWSSASKKH